MAAPSKRPGNPNLDQRKHARFLPRGCDLSVIPEARGLLKLFGRKKNNVAQGVVDLSEGGARFVTRTKLPVGRRVAITINVKLFKDVIETEGTIAWTMEHPYRVGSYYLGVKFTKVDAVQARKIAMIRDYLDSPEYRQKESTRLRVRPDMDPDAIQYDI